MLPLTHLHDQEPMLPQVLPASQLESTPQPEAPPTSFHLTNGDAVWVFYHSGLHILSFENVFCVYYFWMYLFCVILCVTDKARAVAWKSFPQEAYLRKPHRKRTEGLSNVANQKTCQTHTDLRWFIAIYWFIGDLSYLSYVSDIYSHLLHMSVKPYFLWLSLNWMCKNCHIHQQQFHTQCLSISNCCNLFSLFSSLLQRSVLNCIDCTLVVYFKSIIYCSVDYKYSIVCIQVYI